MVNAERTPKSVRVFLRVADERDSKWPRFVRTLLQLSDEAVRVDVSKTFFLKEGSVVYLWRLTLATEDEEAAYDRLGECLVSMSDPVTEVRLTGASPRNAFWAGDGRAEAVIAPHFAMGTGGKP
jgi:hypothetical protein